MILQTQSALAGNSIMTSEHRPGEESYEPISLIPLGVGEAFTALYYTSSLLLGIDDDWLLIDCPHPVRKMLREASIAAGLTDQLDLDRIHAVAVSHLHADHCCGLEDFGYYSFFALHRRQNS